jgi:hypothetical protein
MSQDASTRPLFLNASQNGSTQPWGAPLASVASSPDGFSVESYADRLMDEIFDDVERMLDGGVRHVRHVQQSVRSEPLVRSELEAPYPDDLQPSALPLAVQPQPEVQQGIVSQPEPTGSDIASVQASVPQQKPHQPGRFYERMLLMVGCVSVVVTLAIWLVIEETRRPPVPVASPVQVPASPEAQVDRQFAEYMQQSLQSIDQRIAATGTGTGTVALPPTTLPGAVNLPTVPIPGTPVPSPTSRTTAGLARIYVPVYQPPQLSSQRTQVPPTVAPLPTLPQSSTPAKPASSLATAGVIRTLVGVLELGDRSAALIEINGVAQRFRVGEGIGTTGWTLVEVSKNQAIIRRNGEVRSVFIGQSF